MYAVIRTGGKQYRVAKNDVIGVEKLPGAPGDRVEFGEVLMLGDGATTTLGAPLVEGARVEATILEQTRGPKIIVFKKKRRKHYRRKKGHRQDVTVLRITDIAAVEAKPAKAKKADEPPAAAQPAKAKKADKPPAAAKPAKAKKADKPPVAAKPAKAKQADKAPSGAKTSVEPEGSATKASTRARSSDKPKAKKSAKSKSPPGTADEGSKEKD